MGLEWCFLQAEEGIRDFCLSRERGDVYKGQEDVFGDELAQR